MPTKQGGRALKNASTSDRCSFRRNTVLPAASTPCSWKTRLAMSKPTVVIFMVEAPSVRCTQRPELGTSMPSGVVHRIRFHPLAGEPHFDGSCASRLPLEASQAEPAQERERQHDATAALIPPKEIADVQPTYPGRRHLPHLRQNAVSHRVAECITKDVTNTLDLVPQQLQRSIEMDITDLLRSVE